jgi:hypothetical protein
MGDDGSDDMATAIRQERILLATLCEVERGVFYATYPGCDSALEADELTDYQIGTSVADAKQRIEQRALALGYDAVIWSKTITAPLFASHAKAALPEPATRSFSRGRG